MDEAKLLGSAELPRQQGTLHLFSFGKTFRLTTDSIQAASWMSTESAPSRRALAQIPAKILSKRRHPKILMGGLGLGYTLVECLKQFNLQTAIEVTEWLPEVRQWHEEGVLGEAMGFPVKDDRVTLNDLDIARVLRSKKGRYDAILLDTDNGPEDLLFKENDWLYTFSGLSACFNALEPMGVLAIWAPLPSETLKGKLVRAGFMVEQMTVNASEKGSRQHTIWIAEKLQQD